ncbi:MAG: hypothetical protein J5I99_08490 [Verrucomicrobia bacterium]|nr:hypothetical protein [Kiritimatiellia bacterium]MCO6401248.1 hypothetical protein [Verrucomicrobiota bacterium]
MENANYRPVTTGNWMLTYLLMCIPLVNLILLFVWAFGSNTPISKANWAKASLIWMVIAIAFYILLFAMFGLGAVLLSGAAQ